MYRASLVQPVLDALLRGLIGLADRLCACQILIELMNRPICSLNEYLSRAV